MRLKLLSTQESCASISLALAKPLGAPASWVWTRLKILYQQARLDDSHRRLIEGFASLSLPPSNSLLTTTPDDKNAPTAVYGRLHGLSALAARRPPGERSGLRHLNCCSLPRGWHYSLDYLCKRKCTLPPVDCTRRGSSGDKTTEKMRRTRRVYRLYGAVFSLVGGFGLIRLVPLVLNPNSIIIYNG